jgi:hypothetical protein
MSPSQPFNESWLITCHEASHAIVAAKLDVLFEYVERGDDDTGQLKPVFSPNDERHAWTLEVIRRSQLMYAAGAASDLKFFQAERERACSEDRRLHEELEKMSGELRVDGWRQDIRKAMEYLDKETVEKVARALDKHKKLNDERVYRLIGKDTPW